MLLEKIQSHIKLKYFGGDAQHYFNLCFYI